MITRLYDAGRSPVDQFTCSFIKCTTRAAELLVSYPEMTLGMRLQNQKQAHFKVSCWAEFELLHCRYACLTVYCNGLLQLVAVATPAPTWALLTRRDTPVKLSAQRGPLDYQKNQCQLSTRQFPQEHLT